MTKVKLDQLFDAGVHFGHKANRWNHNIHKKQ